MIYLGQVTVSLDDTIILHGGGEKKLIEERCEQVVLPVCRTVDLSIYIYI